MFLLSVTSSISSAQQVLICLDEFRPDNGGTMFLPNSHRNKPEGLEEDHEGTFPGSVTLTAPAGSVLIAHSCWWYGLLLQSLIHSFIHSFHLLGRLQDKATRCIQAHLFLHATCCRLLIPVRSLHTAVGDEASCCMQHAVDCSILCSASLCNNCYVSQENVLTQRCHCSQNAVIDSQFVLSL